MFEIRKISHLVCCGYLFAGEISLLVDDDGAEQAKEKELNERIAALRDANQCQREQRVDLDRTILQVQQRLDYYEEMQNAGERLAEANCLLERLEKLLRQKEKHLHLKLAEAARMARLIQEQKDATEKRESERKDLELRFQCLQREVEDLSKENCGFQCEVSLVAWSCWRGGPVSRTNGTTSWKMRFDNCEERRRNWCAT
ncbi:myosin heavy chain, embryonic smooth muscle isoform-like [Macrobrachium nipponense]|uniref:myosin heavy chain, embryonic smooth muscle isoform-like n=1 Tax=Macrobrachium nipponense TaxID=159736 RepID=UPI0030C826E4